jgi:hypothetical protein
MYKRVVKCAGIVGMDDQGREVLCGKETGYAFVSHEFPNQVLVEARKTCSRCGQPSLNWEPALWNRQPVASSYQGPTLYQIALAELERLRQETGYYRDREVV